MKKKLLILLSITAFNSNLFSQTWGYLGNEKFSAGNVNGVVDIKTLSDGTPIVGLAQNNYNTPYIGGAVIMKFNGTNWVNFGTNPLISQNPDEVKLAVDQNDIIYAAAIFGPYIEVFKYDNSTWDNIGTFTNAYSGSYNEISLNTSPSNELYLMYTLTSPNLAKAVCTKYDGTNWTTVGDNDGIISAFTVDATDISFDENGTPYALLAEVENAGRLRLYRFNSTTSDWDNMNSTTVISGNDVIKTNLEVITEDEIYIGSIGRFGTPFNFRPGIVKYDGASYQWLDSLNAPDLTSNNSRMDMYYHNDTIYRAYDKGFGSGGIKFEKYDATLDAWEIIGTNLGDYPASVSNQAPIIAFSNNVPLISFSETTNFNLRSSVISFGDVAIDPTAIIEEINDNIEVYPTIFNEQISIIAESIEEINIIDFSGKVIYQTSESNTIVDTEKWNSGVYIVQIQLSSGNMYTQRLIKN